MWYLYLAKRTYRKMCSADGGNLAQEETEESLLAPCTLPGFPERDVFDDAQLVTEVKRMACPALQFLRSESL